MSVFDLRRCRKEYLSEPFRLAAWDWMMLAIGRCPMVFLSETFSLQQCEFVITDDIADSSAECCDILCTTAKPLAAVVVSAGKQPVGLPQIEY